LCLSAQPAGGQSAPQAPTSPNPLSSLPTHCGLPWTSPVGQDALRSATPVAPLLKGLGTLHYKISTTSDRAQLYFDQGLRLVYGFNHAEAVRSFKEAQRLDPMCAMCYWGESYALGPNINDPLPPEREREAYVALQEAKKHRSHATPVEQSLIGALEARYVADPAKGDRKKLDVEFMNAMAGVAAKFPADPEVNTLYAASIMETRPWEYWQRGGEPHPGIATGVQKLEGVIAQYPDHPGAHHYYIHIVEATSTPDRGVASADKLESLMPGAGHMVHMPSHIYMRVGRYADASASNERAILADEDYIAQCQAQGIYPLGYYPHNVHFLWSAATMEGRSEVAIAAARKVVAKMPQDVLREAVPLQDFMATPYYALVRFGRWDDMLTEAEPPKDLPFVRAMWHYGRAVAFVGKDLSDRAAAEIKALQEFERHPALLEATNAGTKLASIVELARHLATGELAVRQRKFGEAVAELQRAVEMQDAQRYNEPPTWHYPARQSLGAALLEAGRHGDAEVVFREDLRRNRENGWSLKGLSKAVAAQGRADEAAALDARFRRAWERADVTLTSSRF
jgi:tetratricopeptide (TPR) repeat protein